MKRIPDNQLEILDDLSPLYSDTNSGDYNSLVLDVLENRWYMYRYVDNQCKGYRAVTSRYVQALIKKGYLERVMMDAGAGLEEYAMTPAGEDAWAEENTMRLSEENA